MTQSTKKGNSEIKNKIWKSHYSSDKFQKEKLQNMGESNTKQNR